MIIDGKAIAREIHEETRARVASLSFVPTLAVITCAPNFETKKYLALKERKARALGIQLLLEELPPTATQEDFLGAVKQVLLKVQGVIVQLPLPAPIDVPSILAMIPPTHDPDGFGYVGGFTSTLPPVVGAIDVLCKKYHITFSNKRVVVFGAGRLVGAPAARYAREAGAHVTVITKDTEGTLIEEAVSEADIVILGAGTPGLLKAEQVKRGVVVFDASTSEEGGVLVGDADPNVAEMASLFTPVPGGIGPMTVALLFRNLVDLATRQ